MNKDSKIYIAGHTGLVGSNLLGYLQNNGFTNIVVQTRSEANLLDQRQVGNLFYYIKPEYVFLVAAKVGGIQANIDKPAEFIYQNLMIEANVIQAAMVSKVKKLLFLGSSCIYPREALQPMKEEYFLDGKPEPTNEAYALSKIAGISLCKSYNKQYGTNFISLMPPNIYGPGDHFDQNGHVLASLINKFHSAKVQGLDKVILWGTGKAYREFMYVDDLVSAMMFAMNSIDATIDNPFYNCGTGYDISVLELSQLIAQVVGFTGRIVWDLDKPDGMPRKLMDSSKFIAKGWTPKVSLLDGITKTYEWFLREMK